jgi:hypothetical protein
MTDLTSKPELDAPEGPAPTELTIADIVVGEGAEATAGATVDVHYLGVEYDTGDEFDSSWSRGQLDRPRRPPETPFIRISRAHRSRIVVDAHLFHPRGVSAHDRDGALRNVEVLCEELDECVVGRALHRPLLQVDGERGIRRCARGRRRTERIGIVDRDEGPLPAAGFDVHNQVHGSDHDLPPENSSLQR